MLTFWQLKSSWSYAQARNIMGPQPWADNWEISCYLSSRSLPRVIWSVGAPEDMERISPPWSTLILIGVLLAVELPPEKDDTSARARAVNGDTMDLRQKPSWRLAWHETFLCQSLVRTFSGYHQTLCGLVMNERERESYQDTMASMYVLLSRSN
jgi:hypothetical protein